MRQRKNKFCIKRIKDLERVRGQGLFVWKKRRKHCGGSAKIKDAADYSATSYLFVLKYEYADKVLALISIQEP